MSLYRCDRRQRSPIILDAGYVSITSSDICKPSKTLGLHGKKLICVASLIIFLFLISFVNLACLIWFMHKLDWSFVDRSGSKIFRYDKVNQQVEFYPKVTVNQPVYTTKIQDSEQINFLANNIDMHGEQNMLLFDDDQILFNTDSFYFKNTSLIDFTNLQKYKFDDRTNTRIHIDGFNSRHIHNKRLNVSANNRLKLSNITQGYFYSQNLVLEADRHNRRSILCFKNSFKRKKQKNSYGNLHMKSDSVFLDLPRLPLLGNNYRSESAGIYRICICNTTFLFLRSFAHQPCPLC